MRFVALKRGLAGAGLVLCLLQPLTTGTATATAAEPPADCYPDRATASVVAFGYERSPKFVITRPDGTVVHLVVTLAERPNGTTCVELHDPWDVT